jgi:glycosyltransferase involved in cell wall biosynthesis
VPGLHPVTVMSTEVERAVATEVERAVAARQTSGTSAIVYVSPFSHPTNQYSANLRRNLCLAGFEVRSPDDIWKGKAWLHRKPKYVFLSWLEDRILRPQKRSRIIEFVLFAYKLFAIVLQRVSIIWVKHNYRTHGQDAPDWIANRVLQLLEWASVATVVHSESVAAENGWHYLPHPLYDVSSAKPSAQFISSLPDLNQRVAVLGQIRESKGLDVMLREWPISQPLILAGQPASLGYEALIRQIIDERGLDATTVFRELSHEEFDYILGQCKANYVANPDDTMIVSGVFFHAASMGTPVILRTSRFANEMSKCCRSAFEVESPSDIESGLKGHRFTNRVETIADVKSLFGQDRFSHELTKLLTQK